MLTNQYSSLYICVQHLYKIKKPVYKFHKYYVDTINKKWGFNILQLSNFREYIFSILFCLQPDVAYSDLLVLYLDILIKTNTVNIFVELFYFLEDCMDFHSLYYPLHFKLEKYT